MEFGFFSRRGFLPFIVAFALVIVTKANVLDTWYHGQNEETINTYIAREVLGKTIKGEWRDLKSRGVFTESTRGGIKHVDFPSNGAREPLKTVLGYLNYFPLFEKNPVVYEIPVDGERIKLKLTPDRSGTTFGAKYQYTDAAGRRRETDLSNSKTIMKRLIANTKDHPELRTALKSAMPKILRNDIQRTGTFSRELQTATASSGARIPSDVRETAYRNSIEALLSTTVLRKSTETWIAKVNNKVKEQAWTPEVPMEDLVEEQWNEWRTRNFLTEGRNPTTNVKTVTFTNDLSPNEIFNALRYFTHLENGPVEYTVPIDGVPFKMELSPTSAGSSDFTVKRIYTDANNVEQKKDLSDTSSLRRAIDHDVLNPEHLTLQTASLKLRRLFKFPGKDNPPNVYENAVKAESATIPQDVQERVFKNSVDLVAVSIMLQKEMPESYWMHKTFNDIESDLSGDVENKLLAKAAEENWETMKNANMFTETSSNPKEVTFDRNADLTVKDIFEHLRHFATFENQPVIYNFPIDGEDVKLKLAPDGRGSFTAKYLYEGVDGRALETDLTNTEGIVHELMRTTKNHEELSDVLESTMPEIFNQKLDQTGKFETELSNRISRPSTSSRPPPTISNTLKQKALRQTLEAMASMSLTGRGAETWVDRMDSDLEIERKGVEEDINSKIRENGQAQLKLELAASMTDNANEVKAKWQLMKDLGYIETVEDANNKVKEIKFNEEMPYTLKDTFKMLQHFLDIYPDQGKTAAEVTIPIGREDRKFIISKAEYGTHQLAIKGKDKYWPGTTKSKVKDPQDRTSLIDAGPNTQLTPTHEEILARGLNTFGDSKKLANAMIKAVESPLNKQPHFDHRLEVRDDRNVRKDQDTLDTVRSTVEFMVVSMVAEAAVPASNAKDKFNSDLADSINKKRKFPNKNEMPNLERLKDTFGKNLKEGRSPTADMVFIKLLKDMSSSGARFDTVFTTDPDQFPFMKKDGGTALGRQYLFAHGDDDIPSSVILEKAAGDHDGETIAKRARMSCTGSIRRRKREACSLEEVNDHMMVDEKSIKVEDNKVELEIVDRRDATNRKSLEIPITSDELATPQLIKQRIGNSERAGGRSELYSTINRGLAVHGLLFSAIGAIDYFQQGDNLRGSIAVSQSLHTLGGLTGFNEIASKAAKQVLGHAAFQLAKGLDMEKGLERFSEKVGKYMEKGVGKMMGDLPGVGLAFDVYFIEQDVEALANLDLNNPEDVKMLPLRVVDLVLDVDTTVLNLIGTFCPEAEVITEPLIIVLSIVRMAIDDFYVDIMEEMDKVNWNSPWAGFEFIGALFIGILNGAADFFTGGLRREMENYSDQEEKDNEFIWSLKSATSYYQITGKRGDEVINLNQGEMSRYGGYITLYMCDDGLVHLEIGDVTGNHETVYKTFRIDHDVKDIAIGTGESREFLYETKTAKLWAFIPIQDYRVIKDENLKTSSLYGTYYGNNGDNKFYAVQEHNEDKKRKDHHQCDYGKLDIGFVSGHYHYDLYGRGGDDSFFLGPQMSRVTGGKGSDVYFVQSYGGNTIIDNFSEDKKKDMVIMNVTYSDITCIQEGEDLDVLYRNTHHIRVTNWFVPGNTEYYRHVTFKTKDGIIFIGNKTTTGTQCTPIGVVKGEAEERQEISTQTSQFSQVQQIVGSDFDDRIYGNDINNIIDGGKGSDYLEGGKSEDTYIIRAGEGCDTINNYADDYKKTTDVLIFNVQYDRIILQTSGMDLKLVDSTDERSCVTIQNWLQGDQYQHMIFSSLDHLVFKINATNSEYAKIPMILDYSSSTEGVKVSLVDAKLQDFVYHKGYEQVATVSDSMYSDTIIGNKQSNFLSCTGGRDNLAGNGGSDNYIVKKSCELATIVNLDPSEKVDLLLLDYHFEHLSITEDESYSLIINYKGNQPKVVLSQWYSHSEYRHLWIRTKDGVTLRINDTIKALEPVEISKDPKECLCKGDHCRPQKIKFNLRKHPWKTVTRFQLKSSLCSYNIRGNDLNNYIDPGSGNGFNYQHLRGENGADTYVLQHGYGEFNVINNEASDDKNDTLKLGLELSDIELLYYGEWDVVLASKTRPQSLAVRIKNYFRGPQYRHLQVITSDEVTFEIQNKYPFMKILAIDMSYFGSPQNLTSEENLYFSQAQSVKGAENYPNVFNGTSLTREVDGGSKDDFIIGGSGNNAIRGRQGNDKLYGKEGDDVIFGGDGDDLIEGGDGNDYIYGGDGQDQIDGGEGGDTICFKGDGFDKKGVYVDLSGGFGKGVDAEGDTYKSIEHVYGTIHNDTLIGSNSDNHLYGLNGSDTIIAKGGDDHLSGGDGSDRYILDDAYGIKTIDNYATDQVHDTLSLANTNSEDICVFLVGDDLHIQVKQHSISSLLYQEKPLSAIVFNWGKSHEHRHLSILFNDTFWPSHALNNVRQHIEQKNSTVTNTTTSSNFTFISGVDGTFSWTPYEQSQLDEDTQMEILQYDLDNPENTTEIELSDEAIANGTYTISNFTQNKHYIFALLMKYCSAIIAKSYTLTYLGEKRPCSAINVPASQITYNPVGSYAHETQANLTCRQGYKFNTSESTMYTVTCIDGTWNPEYPTCVLKAFCPQIPQPNNGHVRYFTTMEGVDASYVCLEGFQLVGNNRRRCGADGQWAGEDPKCERLNCFQLPNVHHGRLDVCDGVNSTIHGTIQSPKHGLCVNLTCDADYVEYWKVHESLRSVGQQLPVNLQNTWTCEIRAWSGVGHIACLSKARLTETTSNWHEDSGVLQEWDDVDERWKNSLSRNTTIHQRVCAHLVGMKDYNLEPKVLSPNPESIQISCPKIRFAEMITEYEGELEIVVNGKWKRTCLNGPDYSTRLRPVYEQMCRELGITSNKPGVGAASSGPTTQLLICPASDINECKAERHPMTECSNVLQCKRRCNNDYPVANGRVEQCTGKFEGDTCEVVCNIGFRLIGTSTIYCTDGVWATHDRYVAISRCED